MKKGLISFIWTLWVTNFVKNKTYFETCPKLYINIQLLKCYFLENIALLSLYFKNDCSSVFSSDVICFHCTFYLSFFLKKVFVRAINVVYSKCQSRPTISKALALVIKDYWVLKNWQYILNWRIIFTLYVVKWFLSFFQLNILFKGVNTFVPSWNICEMPGALGTCIAMIASKF